jgi:hypothetical protein
MFVGLLAYAHARAGERDKAKSAIRELQALGRKTICFDRDMAIVLQFFGDADATFEWLKRGLRSA